MEIHVQVVSLHENIAVDTGSGGRELAVVVNKAKSGQVLRSRVINQREE